MSSTAHIPHEELALYALSPQPQHDADFAAVRDHLANCAECRNVLAELRGEIALIGLSAPSAPAPAGARDRFLSRIADYAPAMPAKGRMLHFPRLAWGIAAALAILAIGLQLEVNNLNQKLHDSSMSIARLTANSERARQVLDALTSRQAQHVLLTASKTPPQPSGRAVYVAQTGSLIFQASNLQQIATNKSYELWVIPTTGNPVPAGTFRPDATGSASVVMPPMPSGITAKAFGVTVEKAEGSATPTLSTLVMLGAAPAGE